MILKPRLGKRIGNASAAPHKILLLSIVVLLVALTCPSASCDETTPTRHARHKIVFSRLGPSVTGLFIADADGGNEHPLLPAVGLDYNASFSADGKWVVFTSERAGSADIYRIHADGSGFERLTDDPAYDDQASLSPDGKKLAFVSTRGNGLARIWLLDLNRHRYQRLTNLRGGEFRPSWSPDGRWIAFSYDGATYAGRPDTRWELLQSTSLYVVRSDGSELRQLTKPGAFAGSPTWSPDGRRIAYYAAEASQSWTARFSVAGLSQIVSLDVASGACAEVTSGPGLKVSPHWLSAERIGYVRVTSLTQPDSKPGLDFTSGEQTGARGDFRNPSWSPDGKQVVYWKPVSYERPTMNPVYSRDADFELVTTKQFPAYSPDGSKLAVTNGDGVQIMNSDGSGLRKIYGEKNTTYTACSWSRLGDRIAMTVGVLFAPKEERSQLLTQVAVVKPDGSGFRRLTDKDTNCAFPSWSPDGKRLVYRAAGKDRAGLVIMSIEDGKQTSLQTSTSGAPYDNFPAWSPRGDLIAFTSFRDGNFNIYTIKPDGSDLRQLTNSGGNDAHCAWSQDGKWIIFSSSRTGFKDEAMLYHGPPQPYGKLFIMRADGSGVRQLTDNQWEDAIPAWVPEPGTGGTKGTAGTGGTGGNG